MSPPARQPLFRQVLIAMAAGLVIRLAIVPFLYTEWLDPFVKEHWAFGRVARSLVQGHGYGNTFADTGNSALMPPVYTYCLAAVFKIFGVYTAASIWAAAVFNSLLSVLTCIPVAWIAHRAFGERTARWSAWAWALSPYGIYFSADWLWSTALVTLMLAWLFLIAMELQNRIGLREWTGFGLLGGLAALTEPVVLAVVPMQGLISLYRLRRSGKPWLRQASVAALALCAAMSPWIVRNYLTFDKFIPVRDGFGLELYLGNSGYSEHWANRAVHPNHSDAELSEYERSGEIAYMAHKQSQALSYIEAHKAWFAWMTMRRAIYMWTGFWSFDKTYLEQEPLDPPNVFVGLTLSLMAFAGLFLAFREHNPAALRFAAAFFFFPLAYYISHPEAYYFRPLDPLIAILGMFAAVRFVERRRA
jgi:4-amino-4-deoxy-L-arabinose transferase-like glycosyltransferase